VLFDSSGCYGPDVKLEKTEEFPLTEVASSGQSQSGLHISFSLAFETIPNKLEAQVRSSSISVFCSTRHG
jgi:hypothetical protein